ncbi:MAG: 2,3,4,5-tetrahydropyridine-2,6-dicarboxylate N-succinyltransferase [Bacteroidota bacterium]
MLREQIELLYSRDLTSINRHEALQVFNELKFFLNNGEIRSAVPSENGWIVNEWVKKGILLGFRLGELTDVSLDDRFRFYDKSTYPLKKFSLDNQVRIVPGGSSVRDGSYVAKGVVIMPPSYINTGAYIDEGTMIDSHVLVGSCAQIGKHIHLSAGTQIGGVLEPIGALPVIVEDEVFIGANCGIFEGTMIQKRAVLASGVIITASTPVYDIVNKSVYRSAKEKPLTIPEGAVVVPGSRRIENDFARSSGLSVYTPIIIKYRDAGTDAATILEESLR